AGGGRGLPPAARPARAHAGRARRAGREEPASDHEHAPAARPPRRGEGPARERGADGGPRARRAGDRRGDGAGELRARDRHGPPDQERGGASGGRPAGCPGKRPAAIVVGYAAVGAALMLGRSLADAARTTLAWLLARE